MRTVAIIPARLRAWRFPNKVITPILGKPMIEHVLRRAQRAKCLDEVYVACCDVEVAEVVRKAGGKAIMTDENCGRASDRVFQAAATLGLKDDDIVLNIQGDEPMLQPEMVDMAVEALKQHSEWGVLCLRTPIRDINELRDVNESKVITDKNGRILYLCREPVPSLFGEKQIGEGTHWKEVAIIPFRYGTLKHYAGLPMTKTEIYESNDLLRLIENGIAVGTIPWMKETQAIDVPSDVPQVEALLRNDKLYQELFL